MQMFNQYLNQFPATDQQIIQELLRQYQSADPQTRALAQRRLEPYTQQLLQMSTADRMQRRQDAFQAGPAMPEESMNFQVNQPAVTLLESDPVEVIQQAQKPTLSRDFSVQSRMTPQQLIGSGIPTENPTTLGNRFPLENREKLPPLRIFAEPPPPVDPQAMAIIAEAKRKRDAAQPVQRITPPQLPATARANTAVQMPGRPQTSAVQAQSAPSQGGGLLDVDMDFFDDPTRMGLLQAGLGLLSAPRYSTNPNDVTLSSALARGLGGYIEGYGGTKKRLSEAERQKLEDEYKRSQIEFDKLYKTALTNEAIGRTEQMKNLLAKPAKDQKEWEAKVREIYPNPDNKTGQSLIAAGPVEGAKKLAKLAGGMTETERTGLLNKIKNDSVLPEDDKAMLLEMVNERDYEGKLSNSSVAITNAINQLKDDLKPPKESKGDALERAEDILITAEPGSTDIRVSNAFDRIYSKELGENRTFNANTNREEVTKIYPVIPQEIEDKFPELVARRRQLEQGQSVKPPSLSQQQEENRAAALEAYHNEIVENKYDQPEPGYSFQGLRESISPRLASDEYLLKIRAQDRWIENVLRAASGAAIAQSEYADKRAQYFPEPGEGKAAIEAKRRARDIVLQQAKLNLASQMEQARIQGALPQVSEDPDDILLQ